MCDGITKTQSFFVFLLGFVASRTFDKCFPYYAYAYRRFEFIIQRIKSLNNNRDTRGCLAVAIDGNSFMCAIYAHTGSLRCHCYISSISYLATIFFKASIFVSLPSLVQIVSCAALQTNGNEQVGR